MKMETEPSDDMTMTTPSTPAKTQSLESDKDHVMNVLLSPEYEVMRKVSSDHSAFLEDNSPVVVLDWDDTLLCTKHIRRCGVQMDTNSSGMDIFDSLKPALAKLSVAVINLLTTSLTITPNVHLVTCSTKERCEQTCKRFLPDVLPLLKRINCVSARDAATSEEDRNRWKQHTFQSLFEGFVKQNVTARFICIGDNRMEHNAIRYLLEENSPSSVSVCIKLDKWPTVERMVEQLDWITANFAYLTRMKKNLYSLLPRASTAVI